MIRKRLGLSAAFALNSYSNWLPAHHSCNLEKRAKIYSDNLILRYLELARQNSQAVQREYSEWDTGRKNQRLLNRIGSAIEKGTLNKADIHIFVDLLPTRPRSPREPLVLSFGVNVFDSLSKESNSQLEGPALYDQLEEVLADQIAAQDAIAFQKIESDRNGETVSVRYAFWDVDLDKLANELPGGWQILEIGKYSDIYGTLPPTNLFQRGIVRAYKDAVIEPTDGDPLPYLSCPECGNSALDRASYSNEDDTIYEIRCTECSWRASS